MLSVIPIGLFAGLEVLAAQTQEAGDQGLFSGTFADAIWTVLAFILLLIVLSKLAWKPVLERLKARELHIKQQIDAANNYRQQALNLLEEYKQQGTKIVKQANEEAQQRQKELLEKTVQHIHAIRQKAREDIEIAHSTALEQFWNEAGSIVLELSRKVLNRNVIPEDNNNLVRDAIEQIRRTSATTADYQQDQGKSV
jgi:F-type H+-transporting ATPase subunit b